MSAAEDGRFRRETQGDKAAAGSWWKELRLRVAVAEGITVAGRLSFDEPVRVSGNFRGEIKSGVGILVDAGAKVEGVLAAPELYVRGVAKGTLTATIRIVLESSAEIEGTVIAPRLAMPAGAILSGEVRIGYPEQDSPPGVANDESTSPE